MRLATSRSSTGAEAILSSLKEAARGAQQIAAAAEEAGSAATQAAAAAKQQARGAEDLAAAIEEIASLAEEIRAPQWRKRRPNAQWLTRPTRRCADRRGDAGDASTGAQRMSHLVVFQIADGAVWLPA